MKHLHIWFGSIGVAVMLLVGTFNHYVAETRWWWDLSGQTPFYDADAIPFITTDGRYCVGVQLNKRSSPGVIDAAFPISVNAVGANGVAHAGWVARYDGSELAGRELPPGRLTVGPFCITVRNPPPKSAALWVRYRFPDRIRVFKLATVRWDDTVQQVARQ